MPNDPDLAATQKYAAVIAHEFTKRPMTLDEAADFAEVLGAGVALELAADVVAAWDRLSRGEQSQLWICWPTLGSALAALAKEDRS